MSALQYEGVEDRRGWRIGAVVGPGEAPSDIAAPCLLTETVKEGLQACLDAGFAAADIALLTYRGRDSSRILSFDQLGPHVLKKFQGTYDSEGRPGYSRGEIMADTVHRFKGQSAPAVVLAEIDFETLGEEEARRLFVGATRAAMKLVLVMSERAALQLLTRI